jgi:glycerophosphoryl diester phosphodiesterase
MKVITAKEISDRVIIQSFDIRTLQYLHKNYPAIKTALLIEPSEAISVNEKIKRLGFEPDIVSPEQHMVNDKLIEELHGKNIQVIPWTVNDVESIKKFQRQGVDGIITDYPDLFKE